MFHVKSVLRRTLRRWIAVPSVSVRSYLRRSSQDLLCYFSGMPTGLVPPNRLLFDGSESREQYRQDGAEFRTYLVELVGLRPTDSVLDVGCGIGRKASALTTYLGPEGRYEGFDIVPLGIRWCTAQIHSRHPQFGFQHADVFNSLYNPCGNLRASDYRFPYPDESFDVAVAISVFTHMLPCDVDHYVGEISRVLKTGGRGLMSWLLMTEDAAAGIRAGKSSLRFAHRMNGCWAEAVHTPEGAVSYDERDVMTLLERQGLEPVAPIRYGSWCGRERFLSIQDIVVARKRGRESGASATKEKKS